MENELMEVAMSIIMNAGNARDCCASALKKAREGKFEDADSLMADADKWIVKAHNSQTNIIQNEAAGAKHEICLLFIHAQDTLMTIMSEIKLSKEMLYMYRAIYEMKEEKL